MTTFHDFTNFLRVDVPCQKIFSLKLLPAFSFVHQLVYDVYRLPAGSQRPTPSSVAADIQRGIYSKLSAGGLGTTA